MKCLKTYLTVCLAIFLVSSCGGGGGSGSGSGSSSAAPAIPNAAVGGIWQGRDPISGADVIGVIAEDGRAQFVIFDGRPFTPPVGSTSAPTPF